MYVIALCVILVFFFVFFVLCVTMYFCEVETTTIQNCQENVGLLIIAFDMRVEFHGLFINYFIYIYMNFSITVAKSALRYY